MVEYNRIKCQLTIDARQYVTFSLLRELLDVHLAGKLHEVFDGSAGCEGAWAGVVVEAGSPCEEEGVGVCAIVQRFKLCNVVS